MKYFKRVITLLVVLIMFNSFAEEKLIVSKESEPPKINIDTLSFSLENLSYVLDELEVVHKDIVIKQMILETGWGKSYGFRVRNNLFGFYYREYLVFDNWIECCRYLKRWQIRKYKGGDYYEFLVNLPYAEDPNYIYKLKEIEYDIHRRLNR